MSRGRPAKGVNSTYKSYLQRMRRLGDKRLNKAGTIGTEPIAKPDGKGGYKKGTEVKLGRLGKFFIPSRK